MVLVAVTLGEESRQGHGLTSTRCRRCHPDFCAMRSEACCGNSLVCFLIFLFVAPMQAS